LQLFSDGEANTVEDILTDSDCAEPAFWFTYGLTISAAGSTAAGVLDEHADGDEDSPYESAGGAAALAPALDGADEIIRFLEGEPGRFGAENYAAYWAGPALADQGVKKSPTDYTKNKMRPTAFIEGFE
jgi:hypothetical protein